METLYTVSKNKTKLTMAQIMSSLLQNFSLKLKKVGKTQRRQWHPTPVLLPGKSQGRRSLVGCSPWGRTESDTTEATQQQQQMPEVNLRIEKMTEEQKQNGVFLQKKKKKSVHYKLQHS